MGASSRAWTAVPGVGERRTWSGGGIAPIMYYRGRVKDRSPFFRMPGISCPRKGVRVSALGDGFEDALGQVFLLGGREPRGQEIVEDREAFPVGVRVG